MKLAVFSDVHSNIHALDAVLKDIDTRNVDVVICLGDLVGYGAFPGEVVRVIERNGIKTVMGNYDDAVGNSRPGCGCEFTSEKDARLGVESMNWTARNTRDAAREFLRGLPREVNFRAGGYRISCFHGSPRRLNEYLFEHYPGDELLQMMENAGCDILFCGHTHRYYHRVLGDKHVINAGSTGKPKHGDPCAVYALASIGPGVDVEFVKVRYEHEAAAQAVELAGLPAELAAAIRTGEA